MFEKARDLGPEAVPGDALGAREYLELRAADEEGACPLR